MAGTPEATGHVTGDPGWPLRCSTIAPKERGCTPWSSKHVRPCPRSSLPDTEVSGLVVLQTSVVAQEQQGLLCPRPQTQGHIEGCGWAGAGWQVPEAGCCVRQAR